MTLAMQHGSYICNKDFIAKYESVLMHALGYHVRMRTMLMRGPAAARTALQQTREKD